MAQRCLARLQGAALVVLVALVGGSCKQETRSGSGALTASLIFDNASPEVREALASRVDFRITDDNFALWEEAQSNLEELPRSAIPATSPVGSNPVDRAVARLESSPLARQAIERAGLSVREFVLETIALAQASEAAQTGKSMSRGPIPPENFQFVQRYRAQALYSYPRVARAESESYDMEYDTTEVMADQGEIDLQMRLDEAEHQAEMRLAEIETRREEVERATEVQNERAQHEAEMQVERAQHEAGMQVERAHHEAEMQIERAQREAEMRREAANAQRQRDTVPAFR